MGMRKKSLKYYFSVEGETEKWYLEWLQKTINDDEASAYKVSFNCQIQKNPFSRAKSLAHLGKTDIYHFSDYESDSQIHVQQFTKTMDNMKLANNRIRGINYKFGYSNLTFDLWIILHKMDCNGHISHRTHYIRSINHAYDENFENMDAFKHENNFKRCLNKLQLSNAIEAIARAKGIMQRNKENGYTLHKYKGFTYYQENPSLAVWEAIEKILIDCGLG